MFRKLFLDHPYSINEGYVTHLKEAVYCGVIMLLAGCACIIHSIIPALYTKTASSLIRGIVKRFDQRLNINNS
jgi:hypothetical protein